MQLHHTFIHSKLNIGFNLFWTAGLSPSLQSIIQIAEAGEIPSLKAVTLKVVMVPVKPAPNPHESYNLPVSASKDPIVAICGDVFTYGKNNVSMMLFIWGSKAAGNESPVQIPVLSTEVRWFQDERSMLLGWHNWILEENPDIFLVFEVGQCRRMYWCGCLCMDHNQDCYSFTPPSLLIYLLFRMYGFGDVKIGHIGGRYTLHHWPIIARTFTIQ